MILIEFNITLIPIWKGLSERQSKCGFVWFCKRYCRHPLPHHSEANKNQQNEDRRLSSSRLKKKQNFVKGTEPWDKAWNINWNKNKTLLIFHFLIFVFQELFLKSSLYPILGYAIWPMGLIWESCVWWIHFINMLDSHQFTGTCFCRSGRHRVRHKSDYECSWKPLWMQEQTSLNFLKM